MLYRLEDERKLKEWQAAGEVWGWSGGGGAEGWGDQDGWGEASTSSVDAGNTAPNVDSGEEEEEGEE